MCAQGSFTAVGVAFQSLINAESIGYVIPTTVVQHFIDDIEKHGKRTGFCEFGIRIQVLENPQVREYYGMPKELTGVAITAVHPLNHAGSVLKVNDVLLEVDGLPIGGFIQTCVNHFISTTQRSMRHTPANELFLHPRNPCTHAPTQPTYPRNTCTHAPTQHITHATHVPSQPITHATHVPTQHMHHLLASSRCCSRIAIAV